MSILLMSIALKILFTCSLSLIYFYLYWIYREKYIGIWSLSWGFFVIRLILDLFRFSGIDNIPSLIINQVSSILSAYFLLIGTYCFIGKKAPKWWGILTILITVGSDIAFYFKLPFILCVTPTALYFGLIDIVSGVMFLRYWGISGLGKNITGYTLILLGLLNSTYPLDSLYPGKFTAIAFIIGSILEITIIMGTILVYFQKVREELIASESRFRLLAENAKDIIYRYLVPNKCFDYISPAVSNVLGYHPDELYKDPDLIKEILYDNEINLKDNFFQKVLLNKQIINMKMKGKEGNQVWTEQHAVPVFDDSGKLVAIEGIIRDISERKRVEEEIVRLDQMQLLGETAAGIAHEIRNPMTTVRGFIQLFMNRKGMEEFREHFNLIIAELDRANQIISEFLSLSKEKKSNLKLQNLNRIILTLAPLIETNAIVCLHRIEYDLGDIPELMLDENEIRQLILNVVQNGLESMKEEGIVKINTYKDNEEVVLAISDQGDGIEQHILDKIGTPFITSKENGTGLGMVVCFSIVARHNAQIKIETGGSGTIINIRFRL